MIKNNYKIWRNEGGTALLTAMLIMGVLMAISIALSSLVMREVRVTKDLMDAGKAFYAAESGAEEALYFLNNKLPGWQTGTVEDENTPFKRNLDGGRFQYVVKNQCNSYPCIDNDGYFLGEDGVPEPPPEAFYDVLDLNESVLIPLFVAGTDEDGSEVINSVNNFTVEFYGDGIVGSLDSSKVSNVSGWDVLRWKVFGMKKDGSDFITESISDFSSLASNGVVNASAETPSWFGTNRCGISDEDISNDDRVTNSIECPEYQVFSYNGSDWDSCPVTSARDYYGLNADGDVENKGCWSIGNFIDNHQNGTDNSTGLNYLSLTNIMNPAMLEDSVQNKGEVSKIKFRVETYGDPTVREVAEIVSDGYAGNSKQSIKVMKKRDSYMPVFNFSIYSTYGSEGKDDGGVSNYYYENDPKAVLPGN